MGGEEQGVGGGEPIDEGYMEVLRRVYSGEGPSERLNGEGLDQTKSRDKTRGDSLVHTKMGVHDTLRIFALV